MDLKGLRKLNMRRRISCSRAASKYCWGVKYGMVFFLGAKIRWMVGGCQAQNGRFCFFGGRIEDIDAIVAIEAIEAIVDMGFWGCGLGGMEEIKKSASPKKKPLRRKKVGFAEKKLRLWGLAWVAAWVWTLRGGRKILRPYI